MRVCVGERWGKIQAKIEYVCERERVRQADRQRDRERIQIHNMMQIESNDDKLKEGARDPFG